MKKRFVAPLLRTEATLAVLTLGFGQVCSGQADGGISFDSNIVCGGSRTP